MIIKQTDAATEIYVIQFIYIHTLSDTKFIYINLCVILKLYVCDTYNFNSYKIKPEHIATYKTRLTN